MEKRARSDDDEQEGLLQDGGEPLLGTQSKPRPLGYCRKYLAACTLIYLLSLCLASFVTFVLIKSCHPLGSFHNGYKTDFGSPSFGEDGKEFIPKSSPSLEYLGTGAEVDGAWEELVKWRYFLLTDDEAESAWGDDYVYYWDDRRGGYLAGLDMFHTLHCLDHIRKALHPDIYHFDAIHGQEHQDHCIDHLRQMIMCNADLTPIPSKYFNGIGKNYIVSDQMHTCRDFTQVRKWVNDRFNGSLEVPPRNKDGSPRGFK